MSVELLKDVGERAVWTFLQAFLAVLVVGDWSSFQPAVVAGAAAVLSVVKGLVASKVGPDDAALPSTKG